MDAVVKKIPNRMVIYPKDVVNITGKSERTCRDMIQSVRETLGKSKNQFVTVKEFCFIYGLPEDHVNKYL
jgi:hypothetical protein